MLYMEALFQNWKKHMLQIGIPRVLKPQNANIFCGISLTLLPLIPTVAHRYHVNFLSIHDNFPSTNNNFLSIHDDFLSTHDNILSSKTTFFLPMTTFVPPMKTVCLSIHDSFLATHDNNAF